MIEIVWGDRGVIRRVQGTVTYQELDRSAIQMQGSARVDDLRFVIHDFSACDAILATDEEIDMMAARASVAVQRLPRFRVAFVGRQPLVQRLADSFVDLAITGHPCKRFDTLPEAVAFVSQGWS